MTPEPNIRPCRAIKLATVIAPPPAEFAPGGCDLPQLADRVQLFGWGRPMLAGDIGLTRHKCRAEAVCGRNRVVNDLTKHQGSNHQTLNPNPSEQPCAESDRSVYLLQLTHACHTGRRAASLLPA